MPIYEVTFFFRPLAKADLISTIKRQALTLLDQGAVLTDLKSLGHRDLPMKKFDRYAKGTTFNANSVLICSSMSVEGMKKARATFFNDHDLLWTGVVDTSNLAKQPTECDLEDFLRPPAYRPSVEELRKNQRMAHFTRLRMYKMAEQEYQRVTKTYPIAPQLH